MEAASHPKAKCKRFINEVEYKQITIVRRDDFGGRMENLLSLDQIQNTWRTNVTRVLFEDHGNVTWTWRQMQINFNPSVWAKKSVSASVAERLDVNSALEGSSKLKNLRELIVRFSLCRNVCSRAADNIRSTKFNSNANFYDVNRTRSRVLVEFIKIICWNKTINESIKVLYWHSGVFEV